MYISLWTLRQNTFYILQHYPFLSPTFGRPASLVGNNSLPHLVRCCGLKIALVSIRPLPLLLTSPDNFHHSLYLSSILKLISWYDRT